MNRRSFFTTLAKVAAGFTILPGAGRLWKATTPPVLVPFWTQSSRIFACYSEDYLKVVYDIMRKREAGAGMAHLELITDSETAAGFREAFRDNCERFERMTPHARLEAFFGDMRPA